MSRPVEQVRALPMMPYLPHWVDKMNRKLETVGRGVSSSRWHVGPMFQLSTANRLQHHVPVIHSQATILPCLPDSLQTERRLRHRHRANHSGGMSH